MKTWELIKAWQEEGIRGEYNGTYETAGTIYKTAINLTNKGIENHGLSLDNVFLNFNWQKAEQQYSFAEAYEAYKNGAEIESVVTRHIKKQNIYGASHYFSDYEIDGKWLIK